MASNLDAFVHRVRENVPEEVWLRLTQVVQLINDASADVLVVGTARKAICLLDVLQQEGLIRPDQEVVSSRVLDIDPQAFHGRNILVIDDLITSSRTLRLTIEKAQRAGAERITATAMARESAYPVPKGLELCDKDRILLLDHVQAIEFASILIQILDLSGRSYNTDWPILVGKPPANSFDRALNSLPGWGFTVDRSLSTPRAKGRLTMFPRELEISPCLADRLALFKVRVIPPFTPHGATYLVPIVAATSWDSGLEARVRLVQPHLPEGFQAAQAYLQHRIATDLYKNLALDLSEWTGERPKFRERASTLRLSYGTRLANLLRDSISIREWERRPLGTWLCDPSGITQADAVAPSVNVHVWNSITAASRSETHLVLSNVFSEYYESTGEKALREDARQGSVEANKELLQTHHLLRQGLSVQGLELELVSRGYSDLQARVSVSHFLDNSIDAGLVVPVTSEVGRQYRPGEAAMFNDKAKRMCEVLLQRLARERNGSLTRFFTQKSLVALWKYGSQRGILDKGSEGQMVSVQYFQHGAILDEGDATSISASGRSAVTEILESSGVIHSAKGGYEVSTEPIFESRFPSDERTVQVLASMLTRMAIPSSREWRKEQEFYLWISLADKGQSPIALAADIELARSSFVSMSRLALHRYATGEPIGRIIENSNGKAWHTSLNAGWQKSRWIALDREVPYLSSVQDQFAEDEFAVDFFLTFVETVRGGAVTPLTTQLGLQAIDWLLAARVFWEALALLGERTPTTRDNNVVTKAVECADRLGGEGLPLLSEAIESTTRLLDRVPGAVDHATQFVNSLDKWASQTVEGVSAATSSSGSIESYSEFTAVCLLVADGSVTIRSFRDRLNAIKKSEFSSDKVDVVEFTERLALPGVFAVAASGPQASNSMETLGFHFAAGARSKFRAIIFGSLRTDHVVVRASESSEIYCSAFAKLIEGLLKSPLDVPLEVCGPAAGLPQQLSRSVEGRWRVFHEAQTVNGPDGLTRRGFRETPLAVEVRKPDMFARTPMRHEGPAMSKPHADYLVLCPMPVERRALLDVFQLEGKDLPPVLNRLATPIFTMRLSSRSGRVFSTFLALPTGKGPGPARDAVARTLDAVSVDRIIILGIAGALTEEVFLGDVIVANGVIPYDYRKEHNDHTEVLYQTPLNVSPVGINAAASLELRPPVLLRANGEGAVIHVDAIASGDTVVRSELGDVKRYLQGHPARPAVTEMEAGSVLSELASRGEAWLGKAVVVRGVSDRSDTGKDDSRHELAARNAALVLRALLDFVDTPSDK